MENIIITTSNLASGEPIVPVYVNDKLEGYSSLNKSIETICKDFGYNYYIDRVSHSTHAVRIFPMTKRGVK